MTFFKLAKILLDTFFGNKMHTNSYNHSQISETNSSLNVKWYTGKVLISVLQEFFASINKIFILAERLDTRLSFYEI